MRTSVPLAQHFGLTGHQAHQFHLHQIGLLKRAQLRAEEEDH